jgi:hypothetical protein
MQAQNTELRQNLTLLEDEVITKRDSVGKLKHKRDLLRATNFDLKQKSGLIGSDDLLRDFEKRKVLS